MKAQWLMMLTFVPVVAWAQGGPDSPEPQPPPQPAAEPAEVPADVTAVEDSALRMLRLRLEACEARPEAARTLAEPAGATKQPSSLLGQVRPHAAIWGSHLRYTNQWNLSQVSALTLLAGVDTPSWGGWMAMALSQTSLNYASNDFHQSTHLAGGWARWNDLRLGATLGQLATNSTTTDGTWLAGADALWLPGTLGLGLSAVDTKYPSRNVLQLDPQVVWVASPRFEAAVGATAIRTSGAWKLSGHVGATWRPFSAWDLSGLVWYGARQYAVEAGGLSVWSNDDTFWAGYRITAAWRALDKLALEATWLHDLGSAQGGLTHDFQLLGGTVGVRASF